MRTFNITLPIFITRCKGKKNIFDTSQQKQVFIDNYQRNVRFWRKVAPKRYAVNENSVPLHRQKEKRQG
jgi:hypothetical protein